MTDTTVTGKPEFTILEFWAILKSGRIILGASVLAALLLAILYLAVASTYYQVQIVVFPASDQSGSLASPASRLGSLGSLVGLSNSMDKEFLVNLSYLKSRTFTVGFLESEGLVKVLAPDNWDALQKKWNPSLPNAELRADEDSFSIFNRLRTVSLDQDSQIITISLTWKNAFTGAHILNTMIDKVNEDLRQRKIKETANSIKYLRAEMVKNNLAETRQVFSQLLETQIQSMMIANSRKEYAFRVIDPAVPTMTVAHPKKVTVIVMAILAGLLFGSAIILGRYYIGRLRRM